MLAGAVGQTVVLTNVLLGVPGVVPVWLAGYFMSSWPMAALGRTEREPTENDGWVVGVVGILPVGRWRTCAAGERTGA